VQEWHGARDNLSGRIRLERKFARGTPKELTFGKKYLAKEESIKGIRIQGSEEREDTWENLWENHWAGDHEANSRIYCHVTKNRV
jgi:hypothetical protein